MITILLQPVKSHEVMYPWQRTSVEVTHQWFNLQLKKQQQLQIFVGSSQDIYLSRRRKYPHHSKPLSLDYTADPIQLNWSEQFWTFWLLVQLIWVESHEWSYCPIRLNWIELSRLYLYKFIVGSVGDRKWRASVDIMSFVMYFWFYLFIDHVNSLFTFLSPRAIDLSDSMIFPYQSSWIFWAAPYAQCVNI